MEVPNQETFPIPTLPPDGYFLDLQGRQVALENMVINGFDVFDRKQIHFSPDGVMLYRGRVFFPKEDLSTLSQQLQRIYYKYYKPKIPGDFTHYRSKDQSASSSSNSSAGLPQQHVSNEEVSPVVLDDSETAGLLAVPLNIDATVPRSQAYRQYEPRGYTLLAASRSLTRPEPKLQAIAMFPQLAANLTKKRKQIGFSREDIVMFGGLTCTPCRPSDLSDPFLTTLFDQNNFYDTPQDVYDVLAPALKLAEKFITDRNHIGYWSTLAFGERVIDIKITAVTGACHERLARAVPVTDDVYAQTLYLLDRLGKLVEYRFFADEDFLRNGCFGRTAKLSRSWNLAPQYHNTLSQGRLWPSGQPLPLGRKYPKDPWDDAQVIFLHPDFYTTAKRFSATKNHDVAARLRFNFWFAINIVHELCHVFENKSSQANFDRIAATCNSIEEFKQIADPRLAVGTYEAYWGNSRWAEAGGRWEWETFGGRVHPINGKTDASRGMVLYNADGYGALATPVQADRPVGSCIRMAFMEEVQQQSFWMRPRRTLKFPLYGARAYIYTDMLLTDIDDYLRDQEALYPIVANPVTDPADLQLAQLLAAAVAQTDSTGNDERPSKRRKINDTAPNATKRRAIKNLPRRGRLGQPLIRRYINKADADVKAIHEEAMAQFARDEEQRGREAAIERATAEEARRYHSPSPGQRDLHEFFAYPEEDHQDQGGAEQQTEEPYFDPATKNLADLTRDDKWKLAEEFTCLAMKWEPVEFQAQRIAHPAWRPLEPFNPDDPTNFTPQAIEALMDLRRMNPGESWPERQAAEKAQYEQKKVIASRFAEIDELLTYMGFSRIFCHRIFAEEGKFPMGMTMGNWPAYKPMLDAYRLLQRVQNTSDYVSAMQNGQISAGATGVGLKNEGNNLTAQPVVEHTVKITDYFQKARPTDLRASSASTASLPEDNSGFPALSKIPTPEEMVRKYEAWVAAGADMKTPPEGLHPAQLLSRSLGGSLCTLLPSKLKKVVEERTRKLEADMETQRRMEAKARADAVEERSRRERRSNGSRSTDSEL